MTRKADFRHGGVFLVEIIELPSTISRLPSGAAASLPQRTCTETAIYGSEYLGKVRLDLLVH